MAKIRVTCPKCSTNYQVDRVHVGRKGRCRQCGTAFVIASVEQTAAPSEGLAAQEPRDDEPPEGFRRLVQELCAQEPSDDEPCEGLAEPTCTGNPRDFVQLALEGPCMCTTPRRLLVECYKSFFVALRLVTLQDEAYLETLLRDHLSGFCRVCKSLRTGRQITELTDCCPAEDRMLFWRPAESAEIRRRMVDAGARAPATSSRTEFPKNMGL